MNQYQMLRASGMTDQEARAYLARVRRLEAFAAATRAMEEASARLNAYAPGDQERMRRHAAADAAIDNWKAAARRLA